jgi:hypothetical protein
MTICADAQLLAGTARALAARRTRERVLGRAADAPMNACSGKKPRTRLDGSRRRPAAALDGSRPRPAAALDRLRASDAAAPQPSVGGMRHWPRGSQPRPALPATPERKGRHR